MLCSASRATARQVVPFLAQARPSSLSARTPLSFHSASVDLKPANRRSHAGSLQLYGQPGGPLRSVRPFSTTALHLRDTAPQNKVSQIKHSSRNWPKHHGYTEEQLNNVEPSHRPPRNMTDRVAWKIVRLCRWGMDRASGVRADQQVDKNRPTTAFDAQKPLSEKQWLARFVYLETIGVVPGIVAGILRHLRSLRLVGRDNGWPEMMWSESQNERMHLLTFLEMRRPGMLVRSAVLGGQVFLFNSLLLLYLVAPRVLHRAVAYLEEEAVQTYTRVLKELDAGQLPKWSDPNFRAPDLAVEYYNFPEGKQTMRNLFLYIRADEAVHRGVNHTLGNIDQHAPNPFGSENFQGDIGPTDAAQKPAGYEKEEVK